MDDYEETYVKIYDLKFIEKIKWLWRKFLFEKMIGYHYSYDDNKKRGKGFHYRKPQWLYKRLLWLYYWMKN